MRYFIVNIVPRNLVVKYKISTAALNFCECLINAKIFDKTYSILPTNISHYDDEIHCDGYEVVTSRLRSTNKLRRIVASFWEQVILFWKIKRKSQVWLYNLTTLNALFVILLKIFKPSVKIYTIVLDFTPEARENKFLLPIINKSDGLIKLADSPLFTVKNAICLPGVVNKANNQGPIHLPFSKDFIVGGNIKEQIVMISMLLDVFSKMPDFTLHISGQAQNPEQIKKYAVQYPNIKYYGFAPYDEYLEVLRKCPYMLSTRDPKEPRNQCNFPSKIMEGLLYNKVIISTIHYPQLDGLNYFEVPSESQGFAESLQLITSLTDVELSEYANQAHKVKEMFNTDVWRKHIEEIENR